MSDRSGKCDSLERDDLQRRVEELEYGYNALLATTNRLRARWDEETHRAIQAERALRKIADGAMKGSWANDAEWVMELRKIARAALGDKT